MNDSGIEGLWTESLASFEQYHYLLNQLLTQRRAELLRWLERVLFSRRDMPLALVIVEKLNSDEKKLLFPLLVRLASKTVPHTGTVRQIINSLPREWVVHNIENVTNPILIKGDSEECRRILELYSELDGTLFREGCKKLSRSGASELEAMAKEFSGDRP